MPAVDGGADVSRGLARTRRRRVPRWPRRASWLTSYDRAWLRPDLMAALTLWAILVPQAMAYATLAGVPAVNGLYTAMVAMVGYALLGSSRYLNQGPESAVAILTATAIAPLAGGDPARAIALAGGLAVLVGLWCVLGGLVGAGVLARYLSRPVLLGYILGSSVLIVVSQLAPLLGLPSGGAAEPRGEVVAVVTSLDRVHWPTVGLGAALVVTILLVRRLAPAVPAYLVAAVLAVVATWALDLGAQGITTVGSVDGALPLPGLPDVAVDDVRALALPALAVALLAFADSVVTAQSLAVPDGERVDANQELHALGAASLLSGVFRGIPVNGSQTRSVVLADSGARSQVSGLVGAALVAVTLLLLTPVFAYLPVVALAAIVVVAGVGLFDVPELRAIARVSTRDAVIAVVAAVGVVGLGMLLGILVAVVLSLLEVARRAGAPHTAVLVRQPGTDRFRDADRVAEPRVVPGLVVYRFDAPLFFANVELLREDLVGLVDAAADPVTSVLIDAEAITDIDSTAVSALDSLLDTFDERGIAVAFARVHADLLRVLARAGIVSRLGRDAFHLEVDDGVAAYVTGTGLDTDPPSVRPRRRPGSGDS